MNVLSVTKYVLNATEVVTALLPVITATIKQVEVIVGPGNGAEKTKLVVELVREFYDKTSAPIPFEQLETMIKNVIVPFVQFYNAVGAFVKTVKAAA